MEREYLLLSRLRENGIPVAEPILTNNNKYSVVFDDNYYWLYSYISGKIIKKHFVKGYLNRAKIFGKAIGRLHLALKKTEVYKQFPRVNLYDQICISVAQNLKSNIRYFDPKLLNGAITDIKNNFRRLYPKLPVQLIHRDLHPANMIFRNKKMVGYLDFEMVQNNIRIFDVCYCATSILVGGFENERNREKWFSIFRSILRGYSKHIHITKAELKSIYYVLMSIQLLFMSYCITRNLKASLYNAKILNWLILNRKNIEDRLR
jgi:Ser/Thr protein kinase RdoA (MazF antagonist)